MKILPDSSNYNSRILQLIKFILKIFKSKHVLNYIFSLKRKNSNSETSLSYQKVKPEDWHSEKLSENRFRTKLNKIKPNETREFTLHGLVGNFFQQQVDVLVHGDSHERVGVALQPHQQPAEGHVRRYAARQLLDLLVALQPVHLRSSYQRLSII